MQVVRQHDDGIDRESVSRARVPKCASKLIDSIDEEIRPTVGEINGKKEAAAGNEIASIVRHPRILECHVESSQVIDGSPVNGYRGADDGYRFAPPILQFRK
jgi:hypothetical protein